MKITLKKEMSLILGLICLVLYISIKVLPNPTSSVVTIPKDNMFIYELDNDNLLVPLNIKIDLNLKIEDKLKLMINKMSNFSDSSFHSILNNDTELLKVNITEGIANLYFNDKLLEINKENELKVLEALSYGCLQFKEINSIRLYVNDKQLTMFKNGTPIADKIDKRIGINNFELSNKYIHDTSNITIYYMKMINNKLYYVPMSKRINNNLMNLKDIANEIVKSISVSSSLESNLFIESISNVKDPVLEEQCITLYMNKNILDVDNTVKKDALYTLALSINNAIGVDKLKVMVDNEVVNIHGSNEDTIVISNIIFNEY